MGLLDDLRALLGGQRLAWDKPYEQMTTSELVSAKADQQVLRAASDDPTFQLACTARIAVINPFLDKRVAEDDAARVIVGMSDAAKTAFALRIQSMKHKNEARHG